MQLSTTRLDQRLARATSVDDVRAALEDWLEDVPDLEGIWVLAAGIHAARDWIGDVAPSADAREALGSRTVAANATEIDRGSPRLSVVVPCVRGNRTLSNEAARAVAWSASLAAAALERLRRGRVVEDFRAAPIALVTCDAAGIVRSTNAEAEALFGYEAGELVGQSIERLVPEAQRTRHAQLREHYAAAPEIRRMGVGRPLDGLHKDGRRIPVEVALTPIRSGSTTRYMAALVDLGKRRSEVSIEARLLQTLFEPGANQPGPARAEQSSSGTFELALETLSAQLLLVAGVERAIAGYRATPRGRLSILSTHSSGSTWGEDPELGGRLLDGASPDGAPTWISPEESASSPPSGGSHLVCSIEDEAGQRLGFLAIELSARADPRQPDAATFARVARLAGSLYRLQAARDEASRQAAEARRARRDLEEANGTLRQLAYTISHDLMTPLVSCSGFLSFLRKDIQSQSSDLIEDSMREIEGAVGDMKRLVIGLGELSEWSRFTPRPVSLNGTRVAEDIAKEFSERLGRAGLELRIPDESTTIWADPNGVREALRCLLRCILADQHGAGGTLRVEFEEHDDATCVVLRDETDCCGRIGDQHLFEYLECHSRDLSPLGVALAVLDRVVRAHGGQVEIECAEPRESSIRLAFPVRGDEPGGLPSNVAPSLDELP